MGPGTGGEDEGGEEDGGEEERVAAGLKGGKSGMGRLLGGGALVNAGPAHLSRGGEGPLGCLMGELGLGGNNGELSVLSTRFS